MRAKLIALSAAAGAMISACTESGPSGPKVGPPTSVLLQAGGTQVGVFGQPTPISPTVVVLDASNQPVPGATVQFNVISGGGSVSATTKTTGSNGSASVTWNLGNTFGPEVLQAAVAGLPPVTFTASAIAPDAGVVAFTLVDPTSDTLPNTLGGPKAPDVLSIRGDFKRDSLILAVTFGGPVSPASLNAASSIAGMIELDMDDKSTTGSTPASNYFGASANLGIEYTIDLFGATSNTVPLASPTDYVYVPVSFAGNSLTIRIAMSQLSNDDGNFGLVAVVGTLDRPTDVVPNAGGISVRRNTTSGSFLAGRLAADRVSEIRSQAKPWAPHR